MVRYLRLLKPPQANKNGRNVQITALVTITSDLGDELLAEPVALYSTLLVGGQQAGKWTEVRWKPSSRSSVIQVQAPLLHRSSQTYQLLITSTKNVDPDSLCDDMPLVLSMRCEPETPGSMTLTRTVERRFRNDLGDIAIREETGESIARHIWDASLGLLKFLEGNMQAKDPDSGARRALGPILSTRASSLHVLELGTGCGIVGIYLASALSECKLVLTDLPEAMELLDMNIKTAARRAGSELISAVLDWEKPVPECIKATTYDLIVVSDCTYNCDTVPSLIRTMKSILAFSPTAIVLVSMKRRHESERIFYELMSQNDMLHLHEACIALPSSQVAATSSAPSDMIEVHVYCSSTARELVTDGK